MESNRREKPRYQASTSIVGTFVDPHVIDGHGLREFGGRVGTAGPSSAYCDIEQHEEWVVVRPLGAFRDFIGSACGVEVIVNVEADCFRFPLDGIHMEVVGETRVSRQREGRADTLVAAVFGTMNSAVHEGRFLADILHDVDLATLGPADFGDVVSEHPERGPNSLAAGNLDVGLEASIFLRKLSE